MAKEKFNSHEHVPELVPATLLLPADRVDLHVPKELSHTVTTTTPREVGYAFFKNDLGLSPERAILTIYERDGLPTERLFQEGHGNHIGRTIMRAMLDPERLAPIDMAKAYDNELASSRFSNPEQRYFFEHFVENFGVLSNRTET